MGRATSLRWHSVSDKRKITWKIMPIIYSLVFIRIFVSLYSLLAARCDFVIRNNTWKSSSSQLLRKTGMRFANNLFHIGIILLFFGHFVGLLTPPQIYHIFITPAHKQLMAMVAGGIFGIITFIGITILVYRRLFDERIRATSSFSDIFVLLLLYIQLILGLLTIFESTHHLDGHNMTLLAQWAQYILTFRIGAATFLLEQNWIFKAHIFLGLTIFLIFPFTRLVHILSAPFEYLFRSGYQIVRKKS